MTLVDTSAWVEFLRATGSEVSDRVGELVAEGFTTCQPIRMEVLAGARSERHLAQLRGLLALGSLLPTLPADYEQAASIYRTCRQHGETVRKLIDCLIAAHGIRAGLAVLHADSDFDAIARHTPLVVTSPGR